MSRRYRLHLSPLNGITFLFNGLFYARVIFTPSTLVVINTGLYRMGIRDFYSENIKSNGVSAGQGERVVTCQACTFHSRYQYHFESLHLRTVIRINIIYFCLGKRDTDSCPLYPIMDFGQIIS